MMMSTHWFSARDLGDGLTHITEPHVHTYLRCNIWHLRGRDTDVVIDSGLGLVSLVEAFPELFAGRRVLAVATHYHFDHVGGLHEFEHRAIHESEADFISDPAEMTGRLHTRGATAADLAPLAEVGYDLPVEAELLSAAPYDGFDSEDYSLTTCTATRLLHDGDVVELGDRSLEVLHLPGHSRGSIGLWDPDRRVLFSGDAVYDGPLLDFGRDADVAAYCRTMRRLRDIPARQVHGGHEASFDGERLRAICDDYLERREGSAEASGSGSESESPSGPAGSP
ncbi:MAG: MBL fold metallo-hydrolase [Acidimicrobiales bacterium]